ncbi:MAG: hypothetical protein Q7W45_09655 [Bacteroidota bacterium]|nr:hypothetical protein [Bacteroidota bacterium]MDP3144055.1 hypothetical protein [Bacteroidota bacterium]
MKKTILAIVASTFITGTILTSCSTPTEKMENAQQNVTEANKDLNKAQEEYIIDVENYRKETNAKIAANEKSISEFDVRIENEKKDAKADYKKKITELEQKNTDMKKKMDDYKLEGKEKWETFKSEFSREIEELGASINNLMDKNPKK